MDWVCSSASHVCSNSKMVRFISQVNTLDPPWDRCMVGMMGLLVWISTTHIIFRCVIHVKEMSYFLAEHFTGTE